MNKEIFDCTGILSIIILAVQLLLIWGQLRLSKQINKQSLSKEKGYFLIENTNMLFAEGEEKRYQNLFDLENRIGFYVSGNSDVIVKKSTVTIDGIIRDDGIPRDVYFTLDKRANKFEIELNLSDVQFQKKRLDIDFVMELENPGGYGYKETTTTRFKKESEGSGVWILEKYNITFS